MILRDALSAYIWNLLGCDGFMDYAPNGLQVEGRSNIKRICTAVSASEEAVSQAAEWNADALLVHHGYFWKGEDPVLVGMKRQRIAKLILADMNLLAYHLPLDCHVELGNNACLGKLLGLESLQSHRAGSVDNLLWSGSLPQPLSGEVLAGLIETRLNRKPLHIAANEKPISKIAWCSGGAQDYLLAASELGVDAFLSGEVSERTYYQAKESGIHYYACGHHATERYGIQALGAHLADAFDLEHRFLDSCNPV